MRIAGSRILVTGAGHGLGLAIASALARAGTGRLDRSGHQSRGRSCRHAQESWWIGGRLSARRDRADEIADVRDRIECECGPLDGLVNNAGVVFGGSFLEVPLDRHLLTVGVNLSGVLGVTHAFLPGLLQRPAAHIVNIASAAAVIALPQATSYAASKWAVLGFSESLREELRRARLSASRRDRGLSWIYHDRPLHRREAGPTDTLAHTRSGRGCRGRRDGERTRVRHASLAGPHPVLALCRLAAKLVPRRVPVARRFARDDRLARARRDRSA